MARLIAARLGTAALVLLAAVTVTFLAVYAAPGNTVDLILGEDQDNQQLRNEIIALWGLDRPILVQYVTYITGLFQGDLGISYILRKPVTDILGEQILSTVQLTAAAVALAAVLSVTISLLTSGRRGFARRIASGIELVLLSIPSFWLGIVALAIFSFQLGWFSVAGSSGLKSLVLPAAALALPIAGLLTQVLREGLDRALREPFTITARSRGISPLAVRTRHGLRHASLPGLQLAGIIVGSLLGGTVIVEQVFGRPGLGRITVDAVYGKDLPVVLGVALVAAATFVLVSTVVDVLSLLIDPRLRVPSSSGTRRLLRNRRFAGPSRESALAATAPSSDSSDSPDSSPRELSLVGTSDLNGGAR